MHRRRGLFEANATMSNKVRSLARGDRYADPHALQAESAEWCRDVLTALLCGPGPERVARLHSSPHSVTPAIVVESTWQESHPQPRPWSRAGRWTPPRRASQTQRPTSCTPVLAADGRKRHLAELSPLSLLTSKCPSQPPPVGVPLLRPEGAQPRDSGGPSFVSSNPTCPPSQHMNCGCSVAAVCID